MKQYTCCWWVVLVSDLSRPKDRIVTRCHTEEEARTLARSLNTRPAIAGRPLYYAYLWSNGDILGDTAE